MIVQLHGDYRALAALDLVELNHVVGDLHVRHGDVRLDANIHYRSIVDLKTIIGH